MLRSYEDYDFCGWATRFDVPCKDGRTITDSAFRHQDGEEVSLVYQHNHENASECLGHCLLEYRPGEGMYCYGSFNNTENGRLGKELVQHGDIKALSIFANELIQNGRDVMRGNIGEVSLVLKGANPGAYIEDVNFAHGEGYPYDAYIMFVDDRYPVLRHSSISGGNMAGNFTTDELEDIISTMDDDQKAALLQVVETMEEAAIEDIEDYENEEDFDEDEDYEDEEDFDEDEDYEDEDYEDDFEDFDDDYDEGVEHSMMNNAFYDDGDYMAAEFTLEDQQALIHSAMEGHASLKETFLAHADEYGIQNIEYLFPEARNVQDRPDFIKRDTTWVAKFMNAAKKLPFSRIKTMHADITKDEARALGYTKGKYKLEEVFLLLKRTVDPQTVYKKQKIDRDDVIDITDFDVVSWIKSEMRIMLDEEIARAALVGDGRAASDENKIFENHIKPVWTDADLYTIKHKISAAATATDSDIADLMTDASILGQETYKGTGDPTMFTTRKMLTRMLLLRDKNGRRIYKTKDELATACMVKEIVPVEIMEGLTRTVTDPDTHVEKSYPLLAILVNPADYSFGADKGGSINMFDDFDIDYNQMKYLMETRCSGMLTKVYSAVVLELDRATA